MGLSSVKPSYMSGEMFSKIVTKAHWGSWHRVERWSLKSTSSTWRDGVNESLRMEMQNDMTYSEYHVSVFKVIDAVPCWGVTSELRDSAPRDSRLGGYFAYFEENSIGSYSQDHVSHKWHISLTKST